LQDDTISHSPTFNISFRQHHHSYYSPNQSVGNTILTTMFSKSILTGLVGCAIISVSSALPSSMSTLPGFRRPAWRPAHLSIHLRWEHDCAVHTLTCASDVLNATLSRPPVTVEESMTFCNAVGRGDSPVPEWFWKKLHRGFKTTTDIFANSHKIRFARFMDDVCGLCPEFPKQPEHYQVGNYDKLASGRCKTFESEQNWNSFMFDYGSKVSQCRIDVFDKAHCAGPITHCKTLSHTSDDYSAVADTNQQAYESNAEDHCQSIPNGAKSVQVNCGKSHSQVEFLRWPVDEVKSCPAIDYSADNDNADQQKSSPPPDMPRDEPASMPLSPGAAMPLIAPGIDFPNAEDAPNLADVEAASRIKTVVRQEYDVVPDNGTSFAYFAHGDCGSCGSSNEEGIAMLLKSGQCQTLPSNFTSFYFKFGDSVQSVNLQVFNETACSGEPESELASLTQSWRH
jgi:hypothetical protein